MSLASGPIGVTLDRLTAGDLVDAFAFLDHDPVLNVYMLALLLRDSFGRAQDEYWAARRDGRLAGLLYLGVPSGAVLPVGEDPEALQRLGELARERVERLPRRFQVVGTRTAVGPFLERFARSGLTPRLDRMQIYMSLTAEALRPIERLPELRPAVPADLEIVYESGALLRAEELEEDPRNVDPAAYRRRAEEECRDGYTLLWIAADGLRFRASVSALTADAAQVSGVYTPPAQRGRGYARRGMVELCRRLFERSRNVCLFVNDFNAPAIAVYRRIGFVDHAAWRSLFYDSSH
jgi:ribosomal protein S18 acetylase RimI-like enzyme